MDFRSLEQQRDGLAQELAILEREDPPIKVPLIQDLVQFEADRLNDILLSMGPDERHEDEDGLKMIESLVDQYLLNSASSIEDFKYQLMNEHRNIEQCQQIPRIVRLVPTVAHRLEEKLARDILPEFTSSGSSHDQESMMASVDEPKSPVEDSEHSSLLDAAFRNLEECTASAISLAMKTGTLGLYDRVFECLRETDSIGDAVDDEEVRKFVIEKCDEAVECHKKKLDQGQSSRSKQD